jgi:diguanylate cyclase (GGDEF)-like protein
MARASKGRVRLTVNSREEGERLAQLDALGIDPRRPEESLSDIAAQVQEIFKVGLCSINLMLADRQVFKARSGELPEVLAAAGEVDREKSLCTYVVASHVPLVIEDMAATAEWREQYFHSEHGVRFYAGAPLPAHGGQILGTVCLADGSPRSFSAVELERLQLFARRIAAELQLTGAVERARALQAELEATARYFRTLAELSMHLDEANDADDDNATTSALGALGAILDTAGLDWGLLLTREDDAAWAQFAAGALPPELARLPARGLRRTQLPWWSLLNGPLPAYTPDSAAEIAGAGAPAGSLALASLGVSGPTLPEVLVAGRSAGAWTRPDREFLESGARILGGSLRRFQRWRDLRAAALTDELTGLRNRRALEQLMDDPRPLGLSYRVWVGDLHGFKSLNDSMGHAVGDHCLRRVADILRRELRPIDQRFLFRLGGDEILLAMPAGSDGASELNLGSRLQEAVAGLSRAEFPGFDLHLDLGEAQVPLEGHHLEQAVALADSRMYRAKEQRRGEHPTRARRAS